MKILIVEDEPVAARMLKDTLMSLLGDKLTSCKVLHSLTGSKCYIWEHAIDLLFLDLDMHGEDGFDLLTAAVAGTFRTIVVSGHTHRAIEAYEHGVLDFVAKPYDEERIQKALDRFRANDNSIPIKFLSVVKRAKLSVIPIENIMYVEADGKIVNIHQTNGAVDACNKTLNSLEESLPAAFFRIHRSFIANLDFVKATHILPGRKYAAELSGGARLPVSRTAFRLLKQKVSPP